MRATPVAIAATLVVGLGLLAGGCATRPAAESPRQERAAPASADGMSAAGRSLLVRSRSERRAGDYAAASATLERALRIEPATAAVWLELARVRLAQGNFVQAEQLGRKAESFAAADPALAAECQQVIAEALRRQAIGL
jgi:Tfp pilus assembly protein PilF